MEFRTFGALLCGAVLVLAAHDLAQAQSRGVKNSKSNTNPKKQEANNPIPGIDIITRPVDRPEKTGKFKTKIKTRPAR